MAQWCGFGEEQKRALAGVAVIPVCRTKIGGVTHARNSNVGPSKRGDGLVVLIIHPYMTCSLRETNASPEVSLGILCAVKFWPCEVAPFTYC